jgi:exo-1,4-beta-D-glucosaminidase
MFRMLSSALLLLSFAPAVAATAATLPLQDGWRLQSACKLAAAGDKISTASFRPAGWIGLSVPSTVLAAQVAAKIYPDPYFDMNMRKLPGADYPVGEVFANLEMPADSAYRCGWWYRKSFNVPRGPKGTRVWLHFAGINYRANIWVNGKQIADSTQIAGAYRTYNLDVTDSVTLGKAAVLAVETFAPGPLDLGINWVDWNPDPPDKDMGLWGAVELTTTGPVAVRYPFIATHFEDASLAVADVTVTAQLANATDHAVRGVLAGSLAGRHFDQPVELAPGETREVSFSPQQFPQLKIQHPPIWWPVEMGAHPLEKLNMHFDVDGQTSDAAAVRVGIRDFTSELTDKGYRLFRVNGKPILIRGGGWSQDLLMREDKEDLPEQIRMVKDLHLNAIRQEAKLEGEEFYRLTDENGILVLAGWCCCDQWEHWDKWTAENHSVANDSLRSQLLRLRHHASLLVWLNGSDNPPPAEVEQAYLNVEKETLWPNPTLSSASARPTTLGPSGVKMSGPYDYVSPSYWLMDHKHGGAFGFNTETSPGPAIPQPSSLRRFLVSQNLWPINAVWGYHAGGGDFMNLNVFNEAMHASYGEPDSLPAYSRIAQTMAYDGERAMFEAYARNKYTSTGVIQWMLNNGWPSVIWHLYDYYLQTGGGYFGTKLACEPVHVQYSYDDHSIYAVSSLPGAVTALTVHAEVFDLHLHRVFEQSNTFNLAADGSQRVLDIPESAFAPENSVHFVRLEMTDRSGKVVSRNFYWIPNPLTQFDWKKTDYTHTPALQYADMQPLRQLPPAVIRSSATISGHQLRVHLENSSQSLAFQVEVQGFDTVGIPITPLLWNDDFIELMPGEQRELVAELPAAQHQARVVVSGWNIETLRLKAQADTTMRAAK